MTSKRPALDGDGSDTSRRLLRRLDPTAFEDGMEELKDANDRIKTAAENLERDMRAEITRLDEEERNLKERLNKLNEKKIENMRANGDEDAANDDLVEVNAGGKIIVAKRSTLTQVQGSRLEALFSGRWDRKLQRDSHGRIFLDVNPACFRAIVDYLSELAISSEDNPPVHPRVDEEYKHVLRNHLELFNISQRMTNNMMDSDIIKTAEEKNCLNGWLEEDGSGGDLKLLYRSSRDGWSPENFHSKCDNQGCTLTIVETKDGFVLGGYSNTPWTTTFSDHAANKAFLFILSRKSIPSSCKMKMLNINDEYAVRHSKDWGPIFGSLFGGTHDLCANIRSSTLHLNLGTSYHNPNPGPLQEKICGVNRNACLIKELEVFGVTDTSHGLNGPSREKQNDRACVQVQVSPESRFSDDVNKSINEKRESLSRVKSKIIHLEESFKDDQAFIDTFASGDSKDIVTLNVNGTMMATKRSTLLTAKDSALAQQFDDSKWTEQGHVEEWSSDDVTAWARKIDGVPNEIASIFRENEITGRELLTLGVGGLKMIGVKRAGTVCLLLDEIKKLENVSLIDHSSYCFGKILDYLRLKQLHSFGLAKEPALPTVCDSQKSRFEKIVNYYFPGNSAKFILG